MSSNNGRHTLVVEFIGVTGVGKSTLIAEVISFLSARGVRVHAAEEVILARYGLAFPLHRRVRSALILLLSIGPFWRYFLTARGAKLSRLALRSIARGMNSLLGGANLLRNFVKRIGSHLLLEKLRTEIRDCDVVIWDEGVVHTAHNLFVHTGREPKRDEIEEFGRVVPKPDILIWVTAPTAQSAAVLLRRGHPRVHPATDAARVFAAHAQTTFEVLSSVQGLREKIHSVDNSFQDADRNGGTLRARASSIGEFLVKKLGSPEPPQRRRASVYIATLNGRAS